MKVSIEVPDVYKPVLQHMGSALFGTDTYKQTCEACVMHAIEAFGAALAETEQSILHGKGREVKVKEVTDERSDEM